MRFGYSSLLQHFHLSSCHLCPLPLMAVFEWMRRVSVYLGDFLWSFGMMNIGSTLLTTRKSSEFSYESDLQYNSWKIGIITNIYFIIENEPKISLSSSTLLLSNLLLFSWLLLLCFSWTKIFQLFFFH